MSITSIYANRSYPVELEGAPTHGLIEDLNSIAGSRHPKTISFEIAYGTAGFRAKAEIIPFVAFRMGVLAALRSKCKKASIGVMITASHNPVEDNGIKLIDPHGEMLELKWEEFATRLARARDDEIRSVADSIIAECEIDLCAFQACVFIGQDTRPSSEQLARACADGVKAMHSCVEDYGLCTTPQLHYYVWSANTATTHGHPATELGYFSKIRDAFAKFVDLCGYDPAIGLGQVAVDAANGVGGQKLNKLHQMLGNLLKIVVVNDGSNGILNFKCGADFVKTNQGPPEGMELQPSERYASLDGDADRIVYYYTTEDGQFQLMDGDKIATLAAAYLMELLQSGGLDYLKIGVVQTAYANGSSTEYLEKLLKVPVSCALTGVKHLHHEALKFDIGVYFEANGHGTVLFSSTAGEAITTAAKSADTSTAAGLACAKLEAMMTMINQTVGDALSDLLLVEAVLWAMRWTMEDWNKQYTDLPNRLLKVSVKDRNAIQTTDAERRTITPHGLQEAIDTEVSKYSKARSFARPSGTEDVVRIYSEAKTQEEADALAYSVAALVHDYAGGIGPRPVPPVRK